MDHFYRSFRNLKNVLFLILIVSAFHPSAAQKQHIGQEKIYFGAAYYPEVWPADEVDRDIARMKELHTNVVRMAEFSWSLMEPEDGKFEFQWLHGIIDKLHANGIDVILGTPTATPPAWLAEKHPEIFRITENGIRLEHGARRNCSYTSQVYQQYSRRICEAMAREFGNKKGVIAWQTDNEFNLEPDFSPETERLWHQWLRQRYGDINTLNRIWGNHLWSQDYDRFDQIPMPRSFIRHQPSIRYEWMQFHSQQIVDYQDLQLQALRRYSDRPITHNGMPGQQINYPALFQNLDFVGLTIYHSYPSYQKIQSNYDRLRGYGKGWYWLIETAPNYSGGWDGKTWFNHQPIGALRAMIWMSHALGGQGSLFWLWRQHPAAHEMPHGAILSAWGKPMANYEAIKQIGAELRRFSDLLMKTPVAPASIAIFYSHLNDMGLRIEQNVNDLKYYDAWFSLFYQPLANAYLHRDVIHEGCDLSDYKMLIMPLMPRIDPALRQRIKSWVESGGTLLLGPMSGFRTEHWTAFTDFALGDLEPWMGIFVESRIPIDKWNKETDPGPQIVWDNGAELEATDCELWSEALSSTKGKILARYQNGMHHGLPAIIENTVGKGKVILLGTYPGQSNMEQLYRHYANLLGIQPLAEGEPGVLVVPRKSTKTAYTIVINLSYEKKTINLKEKVSQNLIDDQPLPKAPWTLNPYQVIVGMVK